MENLPTFNEFVNESINPKLNRIIVDDTDRWTKTDMYMLMYISV